MYRLLSYNDLKLTPNILNDAFNSNTTVHPNGMGNPTYCPQTLQDISYCSEKQPVFPTTSPAPSTPVFPLFLKHARHSACSLWMCCLLPGKLLPRQPQGLLPLGFYSNTTFSVRPYSTSLPKLESPLYFFSFFYFSFPQQLLLLKDILYSLY